MKFVFSDCLVNSIYIFFCNFREFSEGTDKVTIWHTSYEEEAVGLQASVDKENITVTQDQTNHATQDRIFKSALKSVVAAPDVLDDDAMDLTPLGNNLFEAVRTHYSSFIGQFLIFLTSFRQNSTI